MALSPRKFRNYAAVLVSGGLTGVLVVWPRLRWPDQQPPNLLTTGPLGATLLTAAFALATASTAFLLPMLTPRRRMTSGLFFLTIGLAALSVLGTGEVSGRLHLTGGLLQLRAVELVLLGGILLGGMLVRRWAARRYWPSLLTDPSGPHAEPAEPETLWPAAADRSPAGLAYLAVVAGLGYVLSSQFVLGDGRGQAAFGTWAGFLVATLATHQLLRIGESLWLAGPPLAMGLVGYVAAGMIFGQGSLPPDTRALMALANPCDFAGPAVAGCVMGFWISDRIWRYRDSRKKAAAEAEPGRPSTKARPATKARPTARSRSRRKRR